MKILSNLFFSWNKSKLWESAKDMKILLVWKQQCPKKLQNFHHLIWHYHHCPSHWLWQCCNWESPPCFHQQSPFRHCAGIFFHLKLSHSALQKKTKPSTTLPFGILVGKVNFWPRLFIKNLSDFTSLCNNLKDSTLRYP